MYSVYTWWSLPAAGDGWYKDKPWIWHRFQWPSFNVGNQNRDCIRAWRLFPGHLPDLVPKGNQQWVEKLSVLYWYCLPLCSFLVCRVAHTFKAA